MWFFGGFFLDEKFQSPGENVAHVAFSHSSVTAAYSYDIGTLSVSIVAAAHVVLLWAIDTLLSFTCPKETKRTQNSSAVISGLFMRHFVFLRGKSISIVFYFLLCTGLPLRHADRCSF